MMSRKRRMKTDAKTGAKREPFGFIVFTALVFTLFGVLPPMFLLAIVCWLIDGVAFGRMAPDIVVAACATACWMHCRMPPVDLDDDKEE